MGDDGPVGQLERRQFCCAGRGAQVFARFLAQERERITVTGDHFFVMDVCGAECFLDAAARVYSRATVVTVANEQRRTLGYFL